MALYSFHTLFISYSQFGLTCGGSQPLDFEWICCFDNGADSSNLPALESSSSSESLATFRNVIAAENEAEIYERIRVLENQHYYNIPPHNNPGDYARLVREHFDQALNVDHYREIFDRELRVLEKKAGLQDKLFNLMLDEQNLAPIMELSPYSNSWQDTTSFRRRFPRLAPLNMPIRAISWMEVRRSL